MCCEAGPSDARFWDNLCTSETSSNELCLSRARSLLSCPTKITVARSFQGKEAQRLIDFLDRVLERSCLGEKHWQRGLRLLSKICKSNGMIPASYILQRELIHVGRVRYYGGSADVSDGQYSGRAVAIKHLKVIGDDRAGGAFKRLCREIISWKHLSHPNILPLLGASLSINPPRFCILSEWMVNEDIMKYVSSNPEANRLQLLSEVMAGVAYLHDLSIVHGDLKGSNIFVDSTGTARVGDFGLMTMADLSMNPLSVTVVSCVGTTRWMSPELFDPSLSSSNGRPTRESDCYALGMVIYEVLTGLRPFHRLHGYAPMLATLSGERPKKPPGAESLGFSRELWGLIELCWSKSTSSRSTAQRLYDCISPASLSWDPPQTYPVVGTEVEDVTETDSFGPLEMPCRAHFARRCRDWARRTTVRIIAFFTFFIGS
ncbi:kinase-like domain-containing protein [Thelephora terrestris]|uniref:Kinase-like domain-containing protein n=1 Tax=Thelephora terrestris TaxID=56493 RepID=A0A9P6H2N2_9AGAM|nr:kinase-like domain-containing protein [Thelephora terrestris]